LAALQMKSSFIDLARTSLSNGGMASRDAARCITPAGAGGGPGFVWVFRRLLPERCAAAVRLPTSSRESPPAEVFRPEFSSPDIVVFAAMQRHLRAPPG